MSIRSESQFHVGGKNQQEWVEEVVRSPGISCEDLILPKLYFNTCVGHPRLLAYDVRIQQCTLHSAPTCEQGGKYTYL